MLYYSVSRSNRHKIAKFSPVSNTAVTAHPNISAGGEANLILFQVTGSGGSDLDGTIEVFGGEAGLIIANPNGIACDGCAFTNVNRVDLVTGSGYDADANTFSTIAATDITVEGSALDLSNVDLNIQTGRDFSNDVAINVDTLNITAGADFKNAEAIVAETVTIDVTNFADDISNTGTISSDNLNLIFTDDLYSTATSFNGFNFRNLVLTTDGTFANYIALDLDNLTIKTGVTFSNNTNITVDRFTAIGTYFSNNEGSVINAASFTATLGEDFSNSNGSTINADSFTVTAKKFYNSRFFATINAASFTATVAENFNNMTTAVINADSLTVTATNFNNTGTSTIDAATVTIEVANFASNISHAANSTVSSASLNFILTDDFTHESDSFTGFTNFSNLAITTDGTFTNNDTIDLAGNLTITANSFANSGDISANIFNAIVDSFSNEADATITAAECNLVHTSYTDNGTIACLNFEGDAVVFEIANPTDGLSDNSYTDFNISVNGVVFNNSDSAGTSQLAGDISANPNIGIGEAASIILAQVTGTNPSLLIGALEVFGAEAVVIIANPNGISCNACSFINASRVDLVTGSSYDAGTNTFGTIDENTNIAIIENGLDASSVGILNIQAGSFTNTGGLKANIFNLNVVGDFDYTERGIINATIFDLEVGGDFSHNDAANNFVWAANDTLTVGGTANITANSFNNSGSITVTGSGSSGSLAITAGYTSINQGSIVAGNLDLNADDFFRNLTGGDINVDNLNIIAGGKVTNTANINVGTLSITANNDSTRTNDTTGFYVSNRGNITATSLNIAAVDNFYNRGNITATNFNITRAKSVFFLNREINSFYAAGHTYDGGTISLDGDSGFIADGNIENYGNIDLGSFNLDISADSFTNQAGANVTANTVNLINVNSFIDNGSITATVEFE